MTAKHWTEQELIAHLYAVGPDGSHIEDCAECSARLERMRNARRGYESLYDGSSQVNHEFLAAQRRRIYARLSQSLNPGRMRRFAPALAASLVIAGGLFFYEQEQTNQRPAVKISDTQLVEDVGQIAMNPEPAPVAPLEALFEE
jgi:hypothetical protein